MLEHLSSERISDIWRKEKEIQGLVELTDSSMSVIKTSLKRIREANFSTEKNPFARKLKDMETRLIRFMAEDIVFSRVLKTLTQDIGIVRGYKEPDFTILIPVIETKRLMHSYMKNLESGHAKDLQIPFRTSLMSELILIKRKVNEFVDEWGIKHGPYNEADIVMLPRKYAEILIEGDMAQRISSY